jgi:glycosyltransferase involved in cell wall biosynthesis
MINDTHSNNIIVFRDRLLPLSETFIKSQALMLKRFIPYFVGSRRATGLDLPPERVILVNKDNSLLERLQEKLFKLSLSPPGALVRKLRLLSPSLLHAHFACDAVFALPLAEALNIPMLVTLHGFDVTEDDDAWRRSPFYTCRAFPRRRQKLIASDRVTFIAVSEHIKQRAIEKGYPEDRISVHYIGVDTELFSPVDAIPAKPAVLFVGRLVEKKGCSYLLRAMQNVQKMVPESELIIIGDGPLRGELEEEAKSCLGNYIFLGMQDNKTVKDYMMKSRVICVPSVTSSSGDTEGLPIVVYEAMALGIPVVSTYSAGIPEAVIHEKTGLLSREMDVAGLTDNIHKLLVDDELWNTYSRNSRKSCEEHFSITRQILKLENIYSSMIR